MDELIKGFLDQFGNGGVVAVVSIIIGIFGWSFYKTLLSVFLSEKNIDEIGNSVQKLLERIPDENSKALTRNKIAAVCVDILNDIGYSRMVNPNAHSMIKSARLKILD